VLAVGQQPHPPDQRVGGARNQIGHDPFIS
jgi:hypothetical protein